MPKAWDELLGWHRCSGCQHVFIPRLTDRQPCPRCGLWLVRPREDATPMMMGGPTFARNTKGFFDTWCGAVDSSSMEVTRSFWSWQGNHTGVPPTVGSQQHEVQGHPIILVIMRGNALCFVAGAVTQLPEPGMVRAEAERRFAGSVARAHPWGIEVWVRRSTGRVPRDLAALAKALGYGPLGTVEPSPIPGELPPLDEEPSDVEALLERCSSCGASLSMRTMTGDARCPYCAAPQLLSTALREELARYQREVATYGLLAGRPSDLRTQAARFDRARAHVPAGSVVMACPGCGGPQAHRPGATDERCSYCNAWLLPRETHREAAVHMASRAAEREGLRLRRVEAKQRRATNQMVMGSMLFSGVGFLTYIPIGAFWLFEAVWDRAGIVGVLALGCGSVASWLSLVALGWFVWRRRVARIEGHYGPVQERLAEQLGASAGGIALRGGWTNRWWRSPIPERRRRPGFAVMSFTWSGFPCLLELDPAPGSQRRVVFYIACEWPRAVAGYLDLPAMRARRDELFHAGYVLRFCRGGLQLSLARSALDVAHADPERLMLAVPALSHSMELLRLLRAKRPIPNDAGRAS